MQKCLFVGSLALLLSLGGCLEFDAQEVTVRYDAAADRIDALIVYRGLFAEGGGSSDKPIEKALQDLAEARASGEFTFWNNWPLSVDLTAERPAAPIKQLPPPTASSRRPATAALARRRSSDGESVTA